MRRPRETFWAALGLLIAMAARTHAQSSSPWYWWGEANLRGRSDWFSVPVAGEPAEQRSKFDLGLQAGLAGFIFDPGVAQFSLGLSAALLRDESGFQMDTRTFGGNATLKLFPRGRIRPALRFSHSIYQYSQGLQGPDLAFRGGPASISSAGIAISGEPGGRFAFDAGVSRITPWDSGSDGDTLIEGRLLYDRRLFGYETSAKMEFSDHSFGQHDYRTRTASLDASAVGEINDDWDLRADLRLLQEATGSANGELIAGTRGQGTVAASGAINDRISATLTGALGFVSPSARGSVGSTGIGVNAISAWRWTDDIMIGPAVGVTQSSSGSVRSRASHFGLVASWFHHSALDWNATAQVQWQQMDLSADEYDSSVRSLGGSLGVGCSAPERGPFSLAGSLQVASNQARLAGSERPGSPGTEIDFAGTTEDRMLSDLRASWQASRDVSVSLESRVEWNRVEDSANRPLGTGSSYKLALHSRWRKLSLGLSATRTELVSEATSHEELTDSNDVSFSWQPLSGISLFLTARQSESSLPFAPDYLLRRAEGGASLAIGQLEMNVTAYSEISRIAHQASRETYGATLSISRRFFGWLAAESAAQRRGSIQ